MEKKKNTKTVKKPTKTVSKKPTKSTPKKKTTEKKKKGFTLIELLAVIIILGILMIIAIPSVTRYISDSRKSAYVDTAKEIVSGTRNLVNEGKIGMYDTGTTYYIPSSYIQTENASKSPYGEFTQAYVGVVYDGKGYKYYWISTDDAGQGVENLTLADTLDTDDIKSDLKSEDIEDKVQTTGVGNRKNILILNSDGTWSSPYQAKHHINENGEEYNGLTYDGVPIVISNSDIKYRLEEKCVSGSVSEPLGVTFEATSENSADVWLVNYFSSRADIDLGTSVSIETDAETGDSRVVVGSCTKDSTKFNNLDVSKFLYNGESVTKSYLEEVANDQCMGLREVLESLDTECIKKLIGEPLVNG